MTRISTHVLDLGRGRPAAGVAVRLERFEGGEWIAAGSAETDDDGRVAELSTDAGAHGVHRLIFETGEWFAARGIESFHPRVEVAFRTRAGDAHCHVPLLLSPFGYSTYRGS